MNNNKKAPVISTETTKNLNFIITAPEEKIKRDTKARFNPAIPNILSLEICLIKRKTYIGLITFDESTFVYANKSWKILIKMETSSLFELFQDLYEQQKAVA